jgi:hypothetical protein
MTKEEIRQEAEERVNICTPYHTGSFIQGYIAGAEFGYNKAKEEMQEQDYSLVDFVMQYENGKFKCKYKSGKEFESVDGKIWKEIVLPKENE